MKKLKSLNTQRFDSIEVKNKMSISLIIDSPSIPELNKCETTNNRERSNSFVANKDFQEALKKASIIPQLRKSWIGFNSPKADGLLTPVEKDSPSKK